MIDRKINASEYKTVCDCVLAMWMDKRLRDAEYYAFMNRLNEYAKDCGIKERGEENDGK